MIPSDNELLGKFIHDQDEQSLLEIIRRHSPMVMGVCQSLLWHNEDAEDAFQATFLVLANKADQLLKHSSVAGWLHQVTVRNCRNLKRQHTRKREVELNQEPAVNTKEPWKSISDLHDRELVQTELSRLPKRYREVIILCHIEGQSRAQAAEALDCTTASVKAMLARGRKLLRQRLVRHGIVASTVLGVLAAATQSARAQIPPQLLEATAQLCQGVSPDSHFGSSSESIQLLAQKELVGMNFIAYSKLAAFTIIGISLIALPVALLAQNQNSLPPAVSLDSDSQLEDTGQQVSIQDSSPSQDEDVGAIERTTIMTNQQPPSDLPGQSGELENPLMEVSKDNIDYWELMRSASEARLESFKLERMRHEMGNAVVNEHEILAKTLEERARVLQINLLLNKLRDNANSQSSNTPPKRSTTTSLNSASTPEFVPPASTADIQPGDIFSVESLSESSLNRKIIVASDHTITLPLVGVQSVKGLNQKQFREKLTVEFERFIKEPMIDVYREKPTNGERVIPLASTEPIRGGETLTLESYSSPPFNRIVVVQADLTVTIPLVGIIQGDGLTPKELSEKLNIAAKQFVNDPKIQVFRGGLEDPLKKFK